MDTYIINGHEVEYDTFDLDNMEICDNEIRRIAEAAKAVKNINGGNYISIIRAQCEDIQDAFDAILGEGMARQIFGERLNAQDILSAYAKFVQDINARRKTLAETLTPAPANRAQRREAERAQRRETARIQPANEA